MSTIKCIGLTDTFQGEFLSGTKKQQMKNFLPGEEMDFYANKQLVVKSKARTHVTCPLFGKCGGCQALHIKYDDQLVFKKQFVNEYFKNNNVKFNIEKIHGSPKVNHYRNKVIAAAYNVDNKITKKLDLGLYEENSKNILPFTKCQLENETAFHVLESIKQICNNNKILATDFTKRGCLRHVLVRVSEATGDVLVTFVTDADMFHGSKNLVQALVKKHPNVKTIIQNINKRDTSIVLGEQEKVLYGPGFIGDKINDLSFKISSKTFYQVNPQQMVKLYNRAMEMADINKKDTVLDCYSGIGTISLIAAQKANKVISVELNKDSHMSAMSNARYNKITNVNFINMDATKFMQLEKINRAQYDVVIMDPPRSGSTPEFLDAVINIAPKRVVYVSCDYKTLARDLQVLTKKYKIKDMELFDMFCHTNHIETVVCLELK